MRPLPFASRCAAANRHSRAIACHNRVTAATVSRVQAQATAPLTRRCDLDIPGILLRRASRGALAKGTGMVSLVWRGRVGKRAVDVLLLCNSRSEWSALWRGVRGGVSGEAKAAVHLV